MATKISIDVASVVDITARRNDSFYLKTELTNTDGTIYNLIDSAQSDYVALFEVYDANDILTLGFSSIADDNANIHGSTITVTSSTSTLEIDAPATNITLRSGTYKYKYYVKTTTDNVTNTIMVGKLKVVDI